MEWLKLVEYGRPTVTVVISIDDNYVPLAAAMLASLADNADRTNVYEIVILDCGISDYKRSVLDWFLARHPHLAVRYVAIGNALEGLYVSRHATKSVYARLLIPEICANHDRVVYLDVDTILLNDVAQLYHTALDDAYLAACTNLGNIIGTDWHVADHNMQFSSYLRTILNLSDHDIQFYFNSGVLVLNLKALRETNLFRDCLTQHSGTGSHSGTKTFLT